MMTHTGFNTLPASGFNTLPASGVLTTTTDYQGNTYDNTYWPYANYPSGYIGYMQVIQEPTTCVGKAHVFECDHVETCKCGKIQRVMPKAKKETKR